MVKGLRNQIPIYKEIMHEEENDIPQSYILLRSQISDTNQLFGDGRSQIKNADCDIVLISKGYAEDTTDLHNINKNLIRQHLKNQEINYTEINLGYNETIKSTEHTFSLEVEYIG